MLTPYQRQLTLSYAANVHRSLSPKAEESQDFVEWLAGSADALGLDLTTATQLAEAEAAQHRRSHKPSASVWQCVGELINQAQQQKYVPACDPIAGRLRELGDAVRLTATDVKILEALLLYETEPVVEKLLDRVFGDHLHRQAMSLRHDNLARILGESSPKLRRRFSRDAPLVRTGLVAVDEDQDVNVAPRLRRLAGVTPEDVGVRELLLGKARASELEWADFDHLGQSRDDVAMLLRGALQQNAAA